MIRQKELYITADFTQALCHRQWEQRNLTNSIAIYDDRVEIGNPGVFPPQITTENIKLPHDSYPYNLKIAETLFRSMILENWGSGAKRIIDACKEQGVEEPTWRCEGGFVYVIFKRPSNQSATITQIQDNQKFNHRSTTAQPPLNYRPSTVQVQKLILSMNEGYMTMNEIMGCVGLRHRTTFRENYFLPAIEDGAIGLLYPDIPNHPKQKYHLTEKAYIWKKDFHTH